MKRRVWVGLLLMGAVLILTDVSVGQQPGGGGQLVITAAQPDFTAGTMLIHGRNLGSSEPFSGVVELFVPLEGTVELAVLSFRPGDQAVLVEMPPGIDGLSGTFLLTVTTGSGARNVDSFEVTVGEAGPPGDPGPPGQPGPPGSVPVGGIILWDQSESCPDGFSRVLAYDGRFLVSGRPPGILGGSNRHVHGPGTLSVPGHQHALVPWDHSVGPVDDNSGGTDFNSVTGPAGGGTMTGSSATADSRPEFVTILLCRKSANP